MIPNTSFNVASVQVSALPIQVSQIEGYHKGATDAWLQVHDSCITPANAAVPLLELPIAATSQFQETLQVARMVLYEGLFVGISSTEGTWTASANTMDITVWTDTKPISTNIVGGKTNPVSNLIAWSLASGNATSDRVLYGVIITELLGIDQYLYLFCNSALAATPPVPGRMLKIPANQTVRLYFGSEGLRPFSKVLPSSLKQGCYFYIDADPVVCHFLLGNNNATMLAITN